MMVDLDSVQARYLSVLSAEDLRGDEARGLTAMLPVHRAAWDALQSACRWGYDDPPTVSG